MQQLMLDQTIQGEFFSYFIYDKERSQGILLWYDHPNVFLEMIESKISI